MGVGIRDVAKLAGVAPSTVSRVLNGKGAGVPISEKTAERIQQAAETLQYRPNAAARSLRTTHAQTVGLIARDLLHPFVAELLRVISAECRTRGYHLLLAHAEHSISEGSMLGDILSADRVDGVLIIGDIMSDASRIEDTERLIQTHGHVLTVGAHPSVAGEISLVVDDQCGVSLALEHLLLLGHRSIGYIARSSGPEPWEDTQRRSAYEQFLRRHGMPVRSEAEQGVDDSIASVTQALKVMMALPDRPTAVFVNNDFTALAAVKAALMCGLRVPEDLSIVGFDDMPFAALCSPELTTVRQPIETMGRYAASILLDRITGVDPPSVLPEGIPDGNTLVFAPTLVCRESACSPSPQSQSYGAQPTPAE